MNKKNHSIAVLLLLTLCVACTSAAVIGIDLGTEFIKIGIAKPGSPVDVVLNEQSKRKTPAMIGWRGSERHFGEPAKALSTRFPLTMFKNVNFLMGKSFNKSSPLFARLSNLYRSQTKLLRNRERNGTIDISLDENTRFTPEELMGMLNLLRRLLLNCLFLMLIVCGISDFQQ